MNRMQGEALPQILLWIFILIILTYLSIYILLPLLMFAIMIGILIGSGHALYNYGLAFKNNVSKEHFKPKTS